MRIENTISIRDLCYFGMPRTTEYVTLIDDQTGKEYHQTIMMDVTYSRSAQMEHFQPKGTQVDISS